jgi:hypothetical protein
LRACATSDRGHAFEKRLCIKVPREGNSTGSAVFGAQGTIPVTPVGQPATQTKKLFPQESIRV